MWSKLFVPSFIGALLLALGTITAACGGGDELTLREYSQQAQAVIDEATERNEALLDVEEGDFEGLRDFYHAVLQTSRRALDELDGIDPPAEVEDAHNEYLDGIEAYFDLFENVVNQIVDVETEAELEALFGANVLVAAQERADAACLALQETVADKGIDLNLYCDE